MEQFFIEHSNAIWELITALVVALGGSTVWVVRLKKLWDMGFPLYVELHNGSNLSAGAIATRILSVLESDGKLPTTNIKAVKAVEKAVLGAAIKRAARIDKKIGRHGKKISGHLNLIGNAKKAGLETAVQGDHVVFKSGAAVNYRTGKVDWNFGIGAKL